VDIPPEWLSLFDGTQLENKLHVAALLSTVDEVSRPHLSFLSVGEVLLHDSKRLGLALWAKSQTAANFRRSGQGTLYGAAQGSVWEAQLVVHRHDIVANLALFNAHVSDVRCHSAPYADVTSLVGFRLHDPDSAVDRWRQQINQLRTFDSSEH